MSRKRTVHRGGSTFASAYLGDDGEIHFGSKQKGEGFRDFVNSFVNGAKIAAGIFPDIGKAVAGIVVNPTPLGFLHGFNESIKGAKTIIAMPGRGRKKARRKPKPRARKPAARKGGKKKK